MRSPFCCRQKDSYTFCKNLSNFGKPNCRTGPNTRSSPKADRNRKVGRNESRS